MAKNKKKNYKKQNVALGTNNPKDILYIEEKTKSGIEMLSDETKEEYNDIIKNKKGLDIGSFSGETHMNLSEDQQKEIINSTIEELNKSEKALNNVINSQADIKKAYLDLETRDDPFYVDYNLLFNNVDMLMALSYSNEMKAVFTGTNSADLDNSSIISNTAEYDYREEMGMDLLDYELLMDKYIQGMSAVIWDGWDEETNSPIPKCGPAEYCRPDPNGRGHINKYRYIGWYGKITIQQMKDAGNYFNIDEVKDTVWKAKNTDNQGGDGSNVNIDYDEGTEDSAYFEIYNHFRTKEDGTKCLVTLANGGTLLIRYIELDYEIGGKPVFPISLDFWKPKRGFPMGIKLYDLSARKQKVLSLLLNLAVKQSVRSSLGNHLVVDEKAIKNKNQLNELTEFPEIILVDTNNGQKKAQDIVSEVNRSQVPQDNYTTEDRLKNLNYEETSIGPNQLGISPAGDQTATEIKDNAQNSSIRLSLSSRVSMIFYKDFFRKWLMMYQYHYPEGCKKQVIIAREFGDRYLTFERKYLKFSQDPHIKVVSKFDQEQKNKQQFSNHVVLHTYITQLAAQAYVPLEVRLSMRKALRLMGYPEEEILDYVKESAEEQEAKSRLYLLNNNIKLEPLEPDQVDENHQDYLQVYRQAKETPATRAAVMDRLRLMKIRDAKRAKEQLVTPKAPGANTNGMQNQMTANMIGKDNQQQQNPLNNMVS